MFFGVKATKTTPPEKKQLLRTKEVLACPTPTKEGLFPEIISITQRADGKYLYIVRDWFRKYDSPEESFTDHALLLSQHPRYQKAMRYKSDPYRFAEEIAAAGYATDPQYARKLKIIIDQLS